jgi:hypothetical protein
MIKVGQLLKTIKDNTMVAQAWSTTIIINLKT